MEHLQTLKKVLDIAIEQKASDLLISVGHPPVIRITGQLAPLMKEKKLTAQDCQGFAYALIGEEQKKRLSTEKEIDFSYDHGGKARFRVNIFYQQGAISMALRLIPSEIKTIEDLGLPPVLHEFTNKSQGLVLVTGASGQGKSTTLASLIDEINQTRAVHIITIEDPIEYIYEQKRSIIDQREIRVDTEDFPTALKSVFREDVDVVLIGEMRETETISTAVTAAETGHLVFSTLHTNNAAQTIDRIIDSFPAAQQDQIRIQLAGSLAGIFSQRLIPRISGGLIPAYELLINNNAVQNLIREKRTHEINTVIETGSQDGMIDMNRSLADLARRGEITIENAYLHSLNSKVLEKLI